MIARSRCRRGKTLADIKITPIVAGITVALAQDKTPVSEVSRTLAGCVLKVTNNGLVSLSSGNLVVVANLPTS